LKNIVKGNNVGKQIHLILLPRNCIASWELKRAVIQRVHLTHSVLSMYLLNSNKTDGGTGSFKEIKGR